LSAAAHGDNSYSFSGATYAVISLQARWRRGCSAWGSSRQSTALKRWRREKHPIS